MKPVPAVLSTLVVVGLIGSSFAAGYGSPRQYYSDWKRHPGGYHYRHYYHKPREDYAGYRHHYVVHFPSRPKHHYFYNPYRKTYWGRCPSRPDGTPTYSLLPEAARRPRLNEIPESAFPDGGPLPPVPDAEDGLLLDLPPDDLPPGDAPPAP